MRLKSFRLGDAWAYSRLREDEEGMALVMALMAVIVLAVVLTTVIFLTASGSRDATRTNAGQKAHAIAEAGLNNALAQIMAPGHYPGYIDGYDSWVNGAARAYNGGTVSWTGTFSGSDWTITGTGTVPNPTGPDAASITRTVSATLHVTQVPVQLQPFGIYSDDPNALCTDLGGNVSVNVPIFVRNCLTVRGTFSGTFKAPNGKTYTPDAKIWDPPPWTDSLGNDVVTNGTSAHTVTVNVVNGLTFSGGGAAGTAVTASSDHRLKAVNYGSPSCCQSAVHALSETNSPTVGGRLPTLSASDLYSETDWGGAQCMGTAANPFDSAGGTRNNTGGNLFPGSGKYDCKLTDTQGVDHEISYDATQKALFIKNSWFIDSDLTFPNTTINYTGKGTLYVNGIVTIGSQAKLCASSDCQSWDPTNSSNPNLLIVALNASATPQGTSFQLNGQAMLEANAWAIGNGSGDTSPAPTGRCGNVAGTFPAFTSTGGAYIGGSVWTENGCAVVSGGGVLHTAVALPSGSPVSTEYDILTPISGYKGG